MLFIQTCWQMHVLLLICSYLKVCDAPIWGAPSITRPPNMCELYSTLQWLHNELDCPSYHRRLDCLLKRFSYTCQRKHQSSASLAFVRGTHWRPADSPHKGPVTREYFHLMTSSWTMYCRVQPMMSISNCHSQKNVALWVEVAVYFA